MNLNESIDILKKHNEWRRGSDDIPMENPTTVGTIIDYVIGYLESNQDRLETAFKKGYEKRVCDQLDTALNGNKQSSSFNQEQLNEFAKNYVNSLNT
jgi:hypothetical protein